MKLAPVTEWYVRNRPNLKVIETGITREYLGVCVRKGNTGLRRGIGEAQAKLMLAGLQQGKLDTSLLTDNCKFYFSKVAIDDFTSSLRPLGEIKNVKLNSEALRGGMTFRSFSVEFASKSATLTTYTMPDGKIEQFLVEP